MSVQPELVNYNVKVIDFSDEQWEWCEKQGYSFRVFVNSDGGGYNHHIVEFLSLEHALAFAEHFNLSGSRRLYAEDSEGHIHYLDDEGGVS